jgi:hypothetical protein
MPILEYLPDDPGNRVSGFQKETFAPPAKPDLDPAARSLKEASPDYKRRLSQLKPGHAEFDPRKGRIVTHTWKAKTYIDLDRNAKSIAELKVRYDEGYFKDEFPTKD